MNEPIRILLLAADPEDRTRLRLGEEFQRIQDEIRRGRHAKRFELDRALSTRVEDMTRAVHNFRPHIIHFGGHGSVDGNLCFEDATGHAHSVSPAKLERFFSLVSGEVDCVVLNSCYSVQHAEVITKHIPYLVGMRKVVTDEAAIKFSVGFYQALAGGSSISKAFESGCVLVETSVGDQALQAELKVAADAEKKLAGNYDRRSGLATAGPDRPKSRQGRTSSGHHINSACAGEDIVQIGDHGHYTKNSTGVQK